MLSRSIWAVVVLTASLLTAGGDGARAADAFEALPIKSGDTTRPGKLYLPPNAQGKVPAVIFFHGTDGVDQRYDYHRPGLLQSGIAVFEVDFKSGIFHSARDRPKPEFFFPMAFAALRTLRANPQIDASRIGTLGWSAGATTSVGVSLVQVQKEFLPSAEKPFAAYVGLYGGCSNNRGTSKPDGSPILVLQGTDDMHVQIERCIQFQKQFKNVEFVSYKGVYHEFDKEGEDLVEKDGKILRWNQEAAEDARARVRAFFVRVLKAG